MNTIIDKNSKITSQPEQISSDNYAFLQGRIYSDSGIVLDDSKQYLVESRLIPVIQKENLGSLEKLCARLRVSEDRGLWRQVVEAMTTNETLFFRDLPVFDTLRDKVFPDLIESRKASRSLTIWSSAASSGQEAYSLAMLLLEKGLEDWRIRIVGTDLNSQILDQARAGKYLQIEVNRGLPVKFLIKYFERAGLDWKVKEQLRRLVEFQPFDLRQSMRKLGTFDLILCRNVLIYFDVKTKKQILTEIRSVLNPKGLLLLGAAETTLNLDDKLTRRVIGQSVFYEAP